MQKKALFLRVLCALVIVLLVIPWSCLAEETASTRWANAADEIDKFLDAAFEAYLDGDAAAF